MNTRYFYIVMLAACCTASAFSQSFNRFFVDKTLRVDYYHAGTKGQESLTYDKAYEEGPWPGSKTNLQDNLNVGEYMLRVYDVASSSLIYSRGYSTMFQEWQTTDEAIAGVVKTFHETVRIPFPLNKVQLTISRRDKQMNFHEIFSTVVDPNAPTQVNKEKRSYPFKATKLVDNGAPETKVDLLVLGDGYTKADMEKFRKDAKHFTDVLLNTTPFKERKKDFNVWVIEVESPESGIDKPDKNIWKATPLGTMYNTFGSARYVLTEENKPLRDIASAVPYDAITILLNDNRYGGGGIYNLYSTCYTETDTKGMEWQTDYVYVHEFGHSFAALADEYYTSQIAYVDMFTKGVEPWEPNITALTDPNNIKWKSFMEKGTPLPTPWSKAAFDSLERERAKLDRLAPDYYKKREPLYQASQNILMHDPFAGKVGAFEGGGYASQGIYRPAIDCRMFSLSLVDFDPVCRAAIERMIDYYTR